MDMYNNNSGVPQYPQIDVSYEPLAEFCDELLIDEELAIEELDMKIWRDKRRLKRLKDMTKNGEGSSLLGQIDDDGPDSVSKRMMVKAKDGILTYMFGAMERLKAQGFVYGMVLEDGRTITGSSDNLREWWKDRVRFGRNGPAAIMKYQSQINPCDARPRVGGSSAGKLLELQDTTLISVLLPNCEPPQRRFPLNRGITPPWWPTGKEDYWNQLPLPDDCRGLPPPYKKPHDLKKLWKVGVLIGVIRHMYSNFDNISKIVSRSRTLQERMSSRDGSLWLAALSQEKAYYIDQNLPSLPASEVNSVYSPPNIGFQDRELRDSHQLTCPYGDKTIYQATNDINGLIAPNPLVKLSPSPALLNQDSGSDLPTDFNGNLGAEVTQVQDWQVHWLP